MMAKQWPLKKLGDVISLEYGKPLPKEDRDPDGAFPVYGANGEIARSNKFYHSTSTIIVGRKGSAGELNLTKEKFWPLDVTYFVTFDEEEYEMKFLYYLLQTLDLPSMAKGVKPGINRNDVYAINVRIPPMEEQRRIVSILDEAFNNLEIANVSAQDGITNVQRLFDSQFHQLFSVNEKKGTKYSMSEICSITSVLVDPKKEEFQNLLHVGGANIVTKSEKLIKLKTAEEEGLKSAKFIFDSQMVLYSKIRPYLMKVARPDFEGLCSADIYPLACNEEIITRDYLFYLLLSPDFTHFAIQGSARAGMPKVNRKYLFSYEAILPPLDVQHRVTRSLDELAQKTGKMYSVSSEKMRAIDELKQSILQEAFSGKLTGGIAA